MDWKGENTSEVTMKYVSGTILISVVLILAVQTAVFKKYSVINGTKAEGTGRTVPRIDKEFACCVACEKDPICTAVNHNADNTTCELLDGQPNKLFALTTAEGWNAYFKRLKDVDLLSNAVAYQSSTYYRRYKHVAGLAIDGNSNGYMRAGKSCSHTADTGIRWWMVDFKSKFSVSSVILWNRLEDDCLAPMYCWDRLRYLRLTVGNSLQALDNDYNLCTQFTGPPKSKLDNPVRVNCSRVMYGRYLKIEKRQPNSEALTLCEVEVVQ